MEMSKGVKPLRVSKEQEIEIVKLYKKGISKLDLTKKFKISKPTVNKVLNDGGVIFRISNQEKSKTEDFSGQRFGRLTVINKSHKDKYKRDIYDCICDCGNTCKVGRLCLVNGGTKSCGCLNQDKRRERWLKHGKSNDLEGKLLYAARNRSLESGIICNLEIEDIIIPKFCPILGIPLFKSKNVQSNNSPTLDKIIPSLGYIKGNVKVISSKANRMKQECTIEDLEMLIRYIKENSGNNDK